MGLMDAYRMALDEAIADREAQARWYEAKRGVIDWPDFEEENAVELRALKQVRKSAERMQAILEGRAEPQGFVL